MKKQDVKDLVASELDNMKRNGDDDDEFIATGGTEETGHRFLESKERLSEEEAIIDELLLSVPRSQGYYLKLSKEVRPNEYEFKLRIDGYENWSDLEYEVSNIVRSYTSKAPVKWGSGHYRVTIWRDGGIRGPKHKPIDFFVDALEIDLPGNNVVAGKADVESQLASMSGLIDSVKKIMPQQETLSPADVQKMINDAYMQGMTNASQNKTNEASSTAAMMTGMFALIAQMMQSMNQRPEPVQQQSPIDMLAKMTETMNNMGLGPNNKEKPKSLVEQIGEMKILGLWKEPKDEDPISKLTEMKNLMSIVNDFAGGAKGERPTTIEKIIDVIGPQVPDMIGKVTSTINNAIDYSKSRMGLIQPGQAPTRVVRNNPSQLPPPINNQQQVNGGAQPSNTVSEDHTMLFYSKLFNELHQIISANDQSKFPYIAEQIVKLFGTEQALLDIATGAMSPEAIANAMTMYGGAKFKDQVFQPQMYDYITRFTSWIKEQHAIHNKTQQDNHVGDFVATCSKCKAEYEFSSKAEFDNDPNKLCGFDFENGQVCDGVLIATSVEEPIEKSIEPPNEPAMSGPYGKEKPVDALSPY